MNKAFWFGMSLEALLVLAGCGASDIARNFDNQQQTESQKTIPAHPVSNKGESDTGIISVYIDGGRYEAGYTSDISRYDSGNARQDTGIIDKKDAGSFDAYSDVKDVGITNSEDISIDSAVSDVGKDSGFQDISEGSDIENVDTTIGTDNAYFDAGAADSGALDAVGSDSGTKPDSGIEEKLPDLTIENIVPNKIDDYN